ncbi:hypothetical protein C8R46DRAFT_282506 [Mycena filopes]|nr:hypothetical protein C8R46DRAFT_282506 [Mycena filopes]
MVSRNGVFQNKTFLAMEQLGTTDKWIIYPDEGAAYLAGVDIEFPVWLDILNVSISLSLPPGETGMYIVPVPGNALDDWLARYGDSLDGVLLVRGSHLVGTFTWTRRDIIANIGWKIGSLSTQEIYTPRLNNLQPFADEYLRDTADSTVLTGIATFGGFWTFVNGAFTLIFGANVFYFAFGRRPLSALGIAHQFQRGQFHRQWNEDFPTIRTEGGLPGSKSAGIVAFIRERLVDLGEDPNKAKADHPNDITARGVEDTEEMCDESIPVAMSGYYTTRESGHTPDEIPLLDVDLGLVRKST